MYVAGHGPRYRPTRVLSVVLIALLAFGMLGVFAPRASAEEAVATGENAAATTDGCNDFWEPNNTTQQAVSGAILGVTMTHAFCEWLDVDWVKVDLEAGRFYRIETFDLAPVTDTIVEIKGPQLQHLILNADRQPDDKSSLIVMGAPVTGTYYIAIHGHGTNRYQPDSTYKFRITEEGSCFDSFEPNNDTRVGTWSLFPSQTQTHRTCYNGDADWAHIPMQGSTTYVIQSLNPAPIVSTNLVLHDGNGTKISEDPSLLYYTTGPSLEHNYLLAGSRWAGAGPQATYDLTVFPCNDPTELNNPIWNAKSLALSTTPQAHAFCVPNDEDYVTFDLTAGTTYRMETLNLAAGVDTTVGLIRKYDDGFWRTEWSNDNRAAGDPSSEIVYTPTVSGLYGLWIRNLGTNNSPSATYNVRLTTAESPGVAPETTVSMSAQPNAAGWYKRDLTIDLTATDNPGGSGVHAITYWTDGAQVTQPTTAQGSSAQLTISVEGDTDVYYQATDVEGNVETPKHLGIKLDKTKPLAAVPLYRLAASGKAPNQGALLNVRWSADESGSGLLRYELQVSSDRGGTWKPFTLSGPLAVNADVPTVVNTDATWIFRVRAIDKAGNTGDWAWGNFQYMRGYQEDHASLTYSAGWTQTSIATASGGAIKSAGVTGAKATYEFAGSSVTWIATKQQNRGKAEVRIDGRYVATIDLYSATTQPRQMVFTRNGLTPSRHTLEIRVLGTKHASATGTRVDVDAFVVLP